MLRATVVRVEYRERALGQEVVLVRDVDKAPAERVDKPRLPPLHDVDDRLCLRERVHAHLVLVVVRADAERHHPDRRQTGKPVEHPEQRVVEHRAVVDARAHDHLAVHLDPRVEDQLQPPQARRAAPVAQQSRADIGVGRMNAHVQRPEPLADHPLEVGFREPRERREVSVEERQPVVVVLHIEALAHAFGQLVDETERAVVVAGADAVEHGTRQLDAQGRAVGLVDVHHPFESTSAQVELDVRAVDLDLIRDHVAHDLTVDREHLVTHDDARERGR